MVHAAPLLQHGLVAAVLKGLAVDLELALPAVRLEVRARLLDHRARCACLVKRGARLPARASLSAARAFPTLLLRLKEVCAARRSRLEGNLAMSEAWENKFPVETQ